MARRGWGWIGRLLLWLGGIAVLSGAAAVWAIGPLRPLGGPVELLAFGADGRFGQDVKLDADPDPARPRFPLVLGIRNGGVREASIHTVRLSIPGRYRLLDETGRPLPAERDDGGPLVRYVFATDGEALEPGTVPSVVPGADRLFIEPTFGGLACSVGHDGVPALIPAPPYRPRALATTDAFYSLESANGRNHTGILRLSFDTAVIAQVATVASVNAGPVAPVRDTASQSTQTLASEGETEFLCGEPGIGEIVTATTWRTPGGGRIIRLAVRDTPRLQLFDVDADGTIERETWDADGDGRFESQRTARYRIPRFLLPTITPAEAEAAVSTPADTRTPGTARAESAPDTLRADTMRSDTVQVDTLRTDTLRIDTVRVDTMRADPASPAHAR